MAQTGAPGGGGEHEPGTSDQRRGEPERGRQTERVRLREYVQGRLPVQERQRDDEGQRLHAVSSIQGHRVLGQEVSAVGDRVHRLRRLLDDELERRAGDPDRTEQADAGYHHHGYQQHPAGVPRNIQPGDRKPEYPEALGEAAESTWRKAVRGDLYEQSDRPDEHHIQAAVPDALADALHRPEQHVGQGERSGGRSIQEGHLGEVEVGEPRHVREQHPDHREVKAGREKLPHRQQRHRRAVLPGRLRPHGGEQTIMAHRFKAVTVCSTSTSTSTGCGVGLGDVSHPGSPASGWLGW